MKPMRPEHLCGAIDSLVPFVAAVVLCFSRGVGPLSIVTEKYDLFLVFVLPSCLLFGWRGFVDAKRLVSGDTTWLHPAAEGFAWGFFGLLAAYLLGFVSEAFAAGWALPIFGDPWPIWREYLASLVKGSLTLGGIGSGVGLGISGLNRIVLRLGKALGRRRQSGCVSWPD